ncbi:MAG TPA: CoA-transferase [Pseudolabrys sp.]|nr:CoA-transferase [Pseudolabrys sp.]
MTKVCSFDEAVSGIKDGQTVATVGVIGWITPDKTLAALADRFRKTGAPKNLTFYFPCGTGDGQDIPGMDRVAIPGLMKRIVSGSYVNPAHPVTGKRPELMRVIRENLVEAYSWPIGASMQWLREVARKSPGYMTKIGLNTYIDPRQSGGKLNPRTTENLVERIEFRGQEYLFYPTFPLDVAIIRASASDELGNLSFEDEPLMSSSLALALAVKACGGTVIAQVRRVVERFSRPAHTVRVPASLVDHIVVDPDQMMVTNIPIDSDFIGGHWAPLDRMPRLPLGPDKVIARRVVKDVARDTVAIFGFGASSDAPSVMVEDGLVTKETIHRYPATTEHGPHGGVVTSGWTFSANINPEALLDGVTQFDFIDGGNCKIAALAFAEFDVNGNVNVSKFGTAHPGAGGFIDIAYNAEQLIFAGTFTTGGLKTSFGDGTIRIDKEGAVRKFVKNITQITYPVRDGVANRSQKAIIVTERAVFRVEKDGLVLIEIAKGIDLKTQVLDLMEFAPVRIAEPLKIMEAALFR